MQVLHACLQDKIAKAASDSACSSGPQGHCRGENIRRFRLWGPVNQLQAMAVFVCGTISPESKPGRCLFRGDPQLLFSQYMD